MQHQLIDKKLSVLFDKYRDRDFAANAQKEVEEIRRRALTVGGVTTGAAFVLNELTRLSMRSRKSLLKEELLKETPVASMNHLY
jgi:exonuclease I